MDSLPIKIDIKKYTGKKSYLEIRIILQLSSQLFVLNIKYLFF